MAWFFSLTLAISVVGLVGLLWLKHHEMKTGRFVLGGMRPWVGRFFHRGLVFVERGVPGVAGTLLSRVVRAGKTHSQQILARAIVLFEHTLESTLYLVRQKSQVPSPGAASPFLREVAAHKQKLLRRSSKNRAIFDE